MIADLATSIILVQIIVDIVALHRAPFSREQSTIYSELCLDLELISDHRSLKSCNQVSHT